MASSGQTGLLPVYLVVGTDKLKSEKTVSRLQARLDQSFVDFNLDEREAGPDLDPTDLLGSLQSLPFGPGFRLVIVRNAGKLAKAVSEEIIAYLKDPNPTTVLCLVADSLAKSTRLYKAVTKVGAKAVIDCSAKKPRDLPPLVQKLALAVGKSMDYVAATELVSRVGESTVMLDNQVRTLAALVGDSPVITLDDVEKNVRRVAEVKPWVFLDAVSERNAAKALGLYDMMLKPSLVLLHSLLMTRLRELICARSLEQRGEGSMLGSALGKPDWMVRGYRGWARNFGPGELEQLLVEGAALERVIKGTGDEDVAFVQYVAHVCGTR